MPKHSGTRDLKQRARNYDSDQVMVVAGRNESERERRMKCFRVEWWWGNAAGLQGLAARLHDGSGSQSPELGFCLIPENFADKQSLKGATKPFNSCPTANHRENIHSERPRHAFVNRAIIVTGYTHEFNAGFITNWGWNFWKKSEKAFIGFLKN